MQTRRIAGVPWFMLVAAGVVLFLIFYPLLNPPDVFKLSIGQPRPTLDVAPGLEEKFVQVSHLYALTVVGVKQWTNETFFAIALLVLTPIIAFLEGWLGRRSPGSAILLIVLLVWCFLYPRTPQSWGRFEIGFTNFAHFEGIGAWVLVTILGLLVLSFGGFVDFTHASTYILVVGLIALTTKELGAFENVTGITGEYPRLVYPLGTTLSLMKINVHLAGFSILVIGVVYLGWLVSCIEILRKEDVASFMLVIGSTAMYIYMRGVIKADVLFSIGLVMIFSIAISSIMATNKIFGQYWSAFPILGIDMILPWDSWMFLLATATVGLVTFGRV